MKDLKLKVWSNKGNYFLNIQEDPDFTCVFDNGGNLRLINNGHLMNAFDYDWCRYTGLNDKNKKEVYSGDLVRQSGTLYEIQDCIGGFDCQIWKELKNGGAVEGSCYTFSCLLDYACEVVGNIYENPELIRNTTA